MIQAKKTHVNTPNRIAKIRWNNVLISWGIVGSQMYNGLCIGCLMEMYWDITANLGWLANMFFLVSKYLGLLTATA